jgi:predicted ATPase
MLLADLASSSSEKEWKALRTELSEFGVEAGLFDQIEVIRKGGKVSDPFQIGVKSGGPTFNLVDVGYGVSQVLPLLVDIARRANEDIMFLMQQPEVHLHPRAQAQLGTFFARRAGPKQRFVVETHSDYLIDRVRMEVQRGKLIQAKDVSILYFERYARGARIHNLELDKEGNIVNAPSGYRQFFLNETRSLLGL